MRTISSAHTAPIRAIRTGQAARFALAGIRMVNGGLALIAPGVIIGRFDEQPVSDSAATYGLRMFGIRTILLGVDLAALRGKPLQRALGQAVVIHGTDTATAALLGVSGHVKPRTAIPLTLISMANTALAITAYRAARRDRNNRQNSAATNIRCIPIAISRRPLNL